MLEKNDDIYVDLTHTPKSTSPGFNLCCPIILERKQSNTFFFFFFSQVTIGDLKIYIKVNDNSNSNRRF